MSFTYTCTYENHQISYVNLKNNIDRLISTRGKPSPKVSFSGTRRSSLLSECLLYELHTHFMISIVLLDFMELD